MENGKINPILIKKYKKYIDWILLVYMYNCENLTDILKINTLKRKDVLKTMKKEEANQVDIFKILEENSQNIKDEEVLNLKNQLTFFTKIAIIIIANVPIAQQDRAVAS